MKEVCFEEQQKAKWKKRGGKRREGTFEFLILCRAHLFEAVKGHVVGELVDFDVPALLVQEAGCDPFDFQADVLDGLPHVAVVEVHRGGGVRLVVEVPGLQEGQQGDRVELEANGGQDRYVENRVIVLELK